MYIYLTMLLVISPSYRHRIPIISPSYQYHNTLISPSYHLHNTTILNLPLRISIKCQVVYSDQTHKNYYDGVVAVPPLPSPLQTLQMLFHPKPRALHRPKVLRERLQDTFRIPLPLWIFSMGRSPEIVVSSVTERMRSVATTSQLAKTMDPHNPAKLYSMLGRGKRTGIW